MKIGLVNAEERVRIYPGALFIPTAERRQRVVVGEYVKICRNNERFWVLVTAVENERYRGEVNNDLLWNPDLKDGDVLCFGPEHIYDIITQEMLDSGGPSVVEEMVKPEKDLTTKHVCQDTVNSGH